MERALSQEERIRRAEEIYMRKNREGNRQRRYANCNSKAIIERKQQNLFLKKMILQIAICLVIYFIFYLLQNNNYVFSGVAIEKAKTIITYDINFDEVLLQIENNINKFTNKDAKALESGIGGTREISQKEIKEIENANFLVEAMRSNR